MDVIRLQLMTRALWMGVTISGAMISLPSVSSAQESAPPETVTSLLIDRSVIAATNEPVPAPNFELAATGSSTADASTSGPGDAGGTGGSVGAARGESNIPPPGIASIRQHLERQSLQIEQLQLRIDELESQPATGTGNIVRTNFQGGSTGSMNREPFEFTAKWKHSLWFESPDGEFKANIGGRVEQDWIWVTGESQLESAVGPLEDGVFFRRARIHGAGTIYGIMDMFAEFEAAPVDNLLFQDAWLQIREVPVIGNIRAGHLLVPFGLENMTSARFITFMERSAVHDAFLQEYDPGMMIWNTELDENVRWAVAFLRFDPNESGRAFGDGEYSIAGRVTALPWTEHNDTRLLHVGFSYRLNDANRDRNTLVDGVQFTARTEFRNTPNFVDSGLIPANSADFFGAEVATILGPFYAQAEYVAARVHDATQNGSRVGTLQFSGGYAQVGYFLTGESRTYVRSRGAFGRLIPKVTVNTRSATPFIFQGAWEVAARLVHVDMNDGPINGGRLRTVSLGVNWHLAANSTIFFDYIRSQRKDVAGRGLANMFGMRFQVEF